MSLDADTIKTRHWHTRTYKIVTQKTIRQPIQYERRRMKKQNQKCTLTKDGTHSGRMNEKKNVDINIVCGYKSRQTHWNKWRWNRIYI